MAINLPLYENIDYPYSPEASRGLHWHKGLWFERFFNGYDIQWKLDELQKQHFINEVTGHCGETEPLKHHALQRVKLCQILKGQQKIFKNNWHFVTGMGNNHPVENGFSWHPTLGTPYLTGATVKGLVRAWVEQWSGYEGEALKKTLYNWFGSEDKDPEKQDKDVQTGHLIFFDALPVEEVELHCDIMTPHGGDWYSKGDDISTETYANTLPADWHNPNIIPFLVVKKASLQFMIAPSTRALKKDPQQSKAHAKEAMKALSNALEFLGAGAKTAVGYGHFQDDEIANNRLTKKLTQDKRATLAPKDAFLDWLNEPTLKDRQIAEKFGKQYNKTQEVYKDHWDAIIKILITEKQTVLQRWSMADKNTQEAKAYKKLKEYLPQALSLTRSVIPLEDSLDQAEFRQLKKSLNDKLTLRQQKNPDQWIIQGQFEDLTDLLFTLFEEEATLENALLELVEVETLEKQKKQLAIFSTHLKITLKLENEIHLEITTPKVTIKKQ